MFIVETPLFFRGFNSFLPVRVFNDLPAHEKPRENYKLFHFKNGGKMEVYSYSSITVLLPFC